MSLGTQEIILVMVVALLVFGPKKLPEIGKSVGAALRELRRASNDFMAVIEDDEPDTSYATARLEGDIEATDESAICEDEYQKAGE